MKIRVLIVAASLAATLAADAANVRKNFRVEQKFPSNPGGALVLENPVGDIEIIGSDRADIDTVVMKTVIAINEKTIEEGRQNTTLITGGDDKTRVLRAAIPVVPSRNWSSRVSWRVKVPR